MNTPILDFINEYAKKGGVRAHMPGHKGQSLTGCEKYDITEISGADVLYSGDGIIKQSQDNATVLFDTYASFYSTEGSSLCIKAMLYLVSKGKHNPTIIATRNAHKAFVYGCALLGIEPWWVYPQKNEHLCQCNISAEDIDVEIQKAEQKPCAVFITSPDYLGNILDVRSIADVCDKWGIPLIVDNAHGAYLAFVKESLHPIKLGATMCCDSAHKTLPTLTGGAYLHFGEKGKAFAGGAKSALSLFASTSPSYLILRSLDVTNEYIAKHIPDFEKTAQRVKKLKNELEEFGIITVGSEPFKVCVDLIKSGIMTEDLAYVLDKNGIECEFMDGEFAVFMLSVCTSESDIKRIQNAILSVDKKERKPLASFPFERPERVMSVRDAVLADSEKISVSMALNRVCASPSVSCPPAIPIVVSGERISAQSIALFNRYNAKEIEVVKD